MAKRCGFFCKLGKVIKNVGTIVGGPVGALLSVGGGLIVSATETDIPTGGGSGGGGNDTPPDRGPGGQTGDLIWELERKRKVGSIGAAKRLTPTHF